MKLVLHIIVMASTAAATITKQKIRSRCLQPFERLYTQKWFDTQWYGISPLGCWQKVNQIALPKTSLQNTFPPWNAVGYSGPDRIYGPTCRVTNSRFQLLGIQRTHIKVPHGEVKLFSEKGLITDGGEMGNRDLIAMMSCRRRHLFRRYISPLSYGVKG